MPPESMPSAETGVSRSELGASSLEDTAPVSLDAGDIPSGPGRSRAGARGAAGEVVQGGEGPSHRDGDLAAHFTGKVEEIVSLVRDKTVNPVGKAVRYLIFGLVAAFVGITLGVLFAIFSIRVLTTEVPAFHTRVWASWLIVAGIFWLAGLFLSLKRRPRS